MPTLFPTFILVNVLMMVISVPLIFNLIPPNPLYGIRTPKTMHDSRVWYGANCYGGKILFVCGLIGLVACPIVGLFVHETASYATGCAIVTLVPLSVGLALIFRRIAKL